MIIEVPRLNFLRSLRPLATIAGSSWHVRVRRTIEKTKYDTRRGQPPPRSGYTDLYKRVLRLVEYIARLNVIIFTVAVIQNVQFENVIRSGVPPDCRLNRRGIFISFFRIFGTEIIKIAPSRCPVMNHLLRCIPVHFCCTIFVQLHASRFSIMRQRNPVRTLLLKTTLWLFRYYAFV